MSNKIPPWLPQLLNSPHERYRPLTPSKKDAVLQALVRKRVPLYLACRMAGVSEHAVDDVVTKVEAGLGDESDEKFVIALNMALSEIEHTHVQRLEDLSESDTPVALKATEMLLRAYSPERWGGQSNKERRIKTKLLQAELELAKVQSRVARRLERDDLAKRRQDEIQKSRVIGMRDVLSAIEQSRPDLHEQILEELRKQNMAPVTQEEEEAIVASRDPSEDSELERLAKDLGLE